MCNVPFSLHDPDDQGQPGTQSQLGCNSDSSSSWNTRCRSCCDSICQVTKETSCSQPAQQPLRLHKCTLLTWLCACRSALPAAPLRGHTDGQTLIVQTWGQTLPMLPWQLPLHREQHSKVFLMLSNGSTAHASICVEGSRACICRWEACQTAGHTSLKGKHTTFTPEVAGAVHFTAERYQTRSRLMLYRSALWQRPTCRLPRRLGCLLPLPGTMPSRLRLAASQVA